jgi:hypothetical protein
MPTCALFENFVATKRGQYFFAPSVTFFKTR